MNKSSSRLRVRIHQGIRWFYMLWPPREDLDYLPVCWRDTSNAARLIEYNKKIGIE